MFWLRNDSYLGACPIVQLHCMSLLAGAWVHGGSVEECLTGDKESESVLVHAVCFYT